MVFAAEKVTIASSCFASFFAEQAVDVEFQLHSGAGVLLVIRIRGDFHDHMPHLPFKFFYQVDCERIGVVKRPDVYQLDAFALRILADGTKEKPFFGLCHLSRSEIGYHFIVYHPTPVAVVCDLVITHPYVRPAFAQCFCLVSDFFADTVCFVKSVKDKK